MKEVQLVKEEREVLEDVDRTLEDKVVEDLLRYDLDEQCLGCYFLVGLNMKEGESTELIEFLNANIGSCMPFGLKNAGSMYQITITKMLHLIGSTMDAYIDGIMVKSKEEWDNLKELAEVFDILNEHKLRLNAAKCAFGKLIGMEATLNRFIDKSSDKCCPFFNSFVKNIKSLWDKECELALQQFKQYLSKPPFLSPRMRENNSTSTSLSSDTSLARCYCGRTRLPTSIDIAKESLARTSVMTEATHEVLKELPRVEETLAVEDIAEGLEDLKELPHIDLFKA
ncbi:hypothetical protein Acr_27g0001630 [Actinidia rufa]|uniref:Reverse transcriptase domain-containing protein n=1 Tax=Actinidia rufa TaxID=165716 RepID=A0A7J0H6P1_9ERIC|nr:hypothetical protein Acr_27g0001630 [Actinidia rufa]